MSGKRQEAVLGFLFITLLFDVIGPGSIIPLIPNSINGLTGDALVYGGWLMFTFSIMWFLFLPVPGVLMIITEEYPFYCSCCLILA